MCMYRKNSIFNVRAIVLFGFVAIISTVTAFPAVADNGGFYCSVPPFLNQNTVSPNIMIMLDNSGSMNENPLFLSDFNPSQFTNGHYFGYFNPAYMYQYSQTTHLWSIYTNPASAVNSYATTTQPIVSGDLLNWVSMRKVEIAKDLLVGGNPGVVSSYPSGATNPRTVTAPSTVKLYTEDPCATGYNSSYGCQTVNILTNNFDNSVMSQPSYSTWLVPGYSNVIYPFIGNYNYSLNPSLLANGSANPNAGCKWTGHGVNPCSSLTLAPVTSSNTINVIPNADISIPTNWKKAGTSQSYYYQYVDDPVGSNDGNSTTIYNTVDKATNPAIFGYAPVTALGSNITSVSVNVYAEYGGSCSGSSTTKIAGIFQIKSGATTTALAPLISSKLTNKYVLYTFSVSANPLTSAPWSWNDILGSSTPSASQLLGFGVENNTTASTCYPIITQVYLVINTTSPTGGPYDLVVDTGQQAVTGILDNFTQGTQSGAVARFGFSQYGDNSTGGKVLNPVDFQNVSAIAQNVNDTRPGLSTPLAEAELELVSYYTQTTQKYNTDDYSLYTSATTSNWDPYYYLYSKISSTYGANQYVQCAKSYILLLTDGEPTADDYSTGSALKKIPGATSNSNGLSAVSLWARVNDMRPGSCSGDSSTWTNYCIPGNQNVYTYTVFLYGTGSSLLEQAALNGSFTGNPTVHNLPPCLDPATPGHPTQNELKACFRFADDNNTGIYNPEPLFGGTGDDPPIGYFQGSDAYELQAQITNAIAAILQKAASGTAVSVLTTSSRGVGSMLQAYFQNSINQGSREVTWTGYTQNLWLDPFDNLREDTDRDKQLDMSEDMALKIYYDAYAGATKSALFSTDAGGWSDPTVSGSLTSCSPAQTKDFSSTNYLWEGGINLATTEPDTRTIYTSQYVYKNNGATPLYTWSSPANLFTSANLSSNSTWSTALTSSGTSSFSADQILRYTIGECLETGVNGNNQCAATAVSNIRDRRVKWATDGSLLPGFDPNGNVWKLGDIITSTPKVFANTALNSWDAIYGDITYSQYLQSSSYTTHPAIAFIGANDGMLHAFRVGYLQTTGLTGNTLAQFQNDSIDTGTSKLGQEEWAYVPFNAFPYLRYLLDPNYCHIYFNDLPVTLVDVSIGGSSSQPTDTKTKDSWRTILIGGMRYGGACSNGINNGVRLDPPGGSTTNVGFSSFYAIDITDPLNPVMMWEYSDQDMGYATSYPAIIRTGNSGNNGYWYVAFGSGSLRQPHTGQDLTRTRTGYIYILDLKTGKQVQKLALEPTTTNYHIVGDVIAVDPAWSYHSTDLYFGTSYLSSGGTGTTWKGKIFAVDIPNQDLTSSPTLTIRTLFSDNYPITAALAATTDDKGTIWVYAGSGKYESDIDQADNSQQAFFGFKDFVASGQTTTMAYPFSLASLDNRTSSNTTGVVSGTSQICLFTQGTSTIPGYWGNQTMVTSITSSTSVAPSNNGWYLNLQVPGLTGSERVISKPLAFGGLVDFLTYLPTGDICTGGGTSNLCAVTYNTGVAPALVSIASPAVTNGVTSGNVTVQRCVGLGAGAPPKNEAIIIPPILPESPPQKPGGGGSGTSGSVQTNTEHIKKKVQVSTGAIIELDNNPPVSVTSKIIQWLRK